ncbi:hypothetical protein F0562_023540 [Nyssa sinensis]|uniref:Pentacotripeptide-repeat region of PRORP domain-containing protein n=1 Tax=Nyssa sinensis TaxID=561372 RepID=A0A5J5BI11_9ASTE|nr:hypothetical protein F0562_023540 [Nyssa sinensis]
MLEKGVAPDAMTYTSLLKGLCQEKKLEAALEVFNKSIDQDTLLAQSLLSTFILYLCKEGHFLASSRLLCGLTNGMGHSESNVLFLKCLVDVTGNMF